MPYIVKAYREEGIIIHQIHVQNEVIADQKFPSCVWTGEQLREFIRDYLGPAFEEHEIDTEIWLGTINGPEPWQELFKNSSSDYDSRRINSCLSLSRLTRSFCKNLYP